MISLLTNQPLFADNLWAVLEGGEYEDNELVTVYRVDSPKMQVAYYAKYISLGELPQ